MTESRRTAADEELQIWTSLFLKLVGLVDATDLIEGTDADGLRLIAAFRDAWNRTSPEKVHAMLTAAPDKAFLVYSAPGCMSFVIDGEEVFRVDAREIFEHPFG